MKILIGADPEVFVRDKTTGQFKSAHGLLPGTKETPHVVPNGAVQIDGMATEFNIDPAKNVTEFVNNVQSVFETMSTMLPAAVELVPGIPTALFTDEEMSVQPHEALELGCEPDYNAYTGEENPSPDPGERPIRTAAGHIHIGWTEDQDPMGLEHFDTCCSLVRHLDMTIGLNSLHYDTDNERRTLYGAAGAFRPKPYGVEYRVLSNAWLRDEALMRQVYENTIREVEKFFANLAPNDISLQSAGANILNTGDVTSVDEFQNLYNSL